MKKMKILTGVMIALPVLGAGFAGMPDSVRVWDTVNQSMTYYSYFDLLPVEGMQVVPVLAGLLTCAAAVMAIYFAVTKKAFAIGSTLLASAAGLIAATFPLLLRQEILVIPNVLVPILLAAECGVAFYMKKHFKPVEEHTPPRRRLK